MAAQACRDEARMTAPKLFALVIAAIAMLGAAWYYSSERNLPRDAAGAPLLPGLSAELSGITAVTIRHGAPTPGVQLHRVAQSWTVVERGDYPADVAKLRRLLLSLADARKIEEKTSNPANYAQLGVDDPGAPAATGTEISVVDSGGKHSIIVGKAIGNGSFVRAAASATSSIVEPAISVETDPHYWIDAALIDVPPAEIAAVAQTPATGPAYVLRRASPATTEFALAAVPAGRTAQDATTLGRMTRAFANLTADDVAPAATIDFSHATKTEITLTSGDVISISGAAAGEQRWLELAWPKNAALDAKFRGHAYSVPRYRYEEMFPPLEQWLQPKPAAPASNLKPRH
jgi:hypothetical protein